MGLLTFLNEGHILSVAAADFNAAGMPDLIRPYLVCENLSGGAATTASPRVRVPASLPTLPRKLVRSPPPSPPLSRGILKTRKWRRRGPSHASA